MAPASRPGASRQIGATSLIMGSPDLVEASSARLSRRSSRMLDGIITPEPLRERTLAGEQEVPRVLITSSSFTNLANAPASTPHEATSTRTGLGVSTERRVPSANIGKAAEGGPARPLSAIKQHRSISALSLFAKSKVAASHVSALTSSMGPPDPPSKRKVAASTSSSASQIASTATSPTRLPRPTSMAGLRASMQAGVGARKPSGEALPQSKLAENGKVSLATRLGLRSGKSSSAPRESPHDLASERSSRMSAYGSDKTYGSETIDEDNMLEILTADAEEIGNIAVQGKDLLSSRQATFDKLVGASRQDKKPASRPAAKSPASARTLTSSRNKLSAAPLTRAKSVISTKARAADTAPPARARPLQEATKTPPQASVPLIARRSVRSTVTPVKPPSTTTARPTSSVAARSSARTAVPFPKASSDSPKTAGSSLAPPVVTPRARKISDIDARLERSMLLNDDSPLHKVSPIAQITAMADNDSPQWSAGRASTGSVAARTRTSISANDSPAAKLGRTQRLRTDDLATSTLSGRSSTKQSPVPLRAIDGSSRTASKRTSLSAAPLTASAIKFKPRPSQAQEESSALVDKVVQLTLQLQEAVKSKDQLQHEKDALQEDLAAKQAAQEAQMAQAESQVTEYEQAIQRKDLGSNWDAVVVACEAELAALERERATRLRLLGTFEAQLILAEAV